ncbi:sensor histidine kinase [Desulfopila aestuarii]|uniref:histidine kinase n=1 Tax=Desulfopila aestuarii DSM 18488 TaxID=1121416 RepID=A0A1M7Y9C6_9BACT|nr:hypothetical protein [Desulfopila aestuarii]SHO49128.1 hypothetical protein SAMN02745220_02711 [Desulfopila aestuarii DSM 18488]
MRNIESVDGLCLQVFGAISAMVSHDLKNTLAIINENAGLLDDLALMSGDSGVPAERVQKAAAKVAQQVTRSNTIIKNLNRFAHSGDAPVARAAVSDILQLMADLTTRKAAMRSMTVMVQSDPDHQVELGLFQLEALCYQILVHLYTVAIAGTAVTITSHVSDEGLVIRFAVHTSDLSSLGVFPGKEERVLLEALQGRCVVDEDAVLLTLPAV